MALVWSKVVLELISLTLTCRYLRGDETIRNYTHNVCTSKAKIVENTDGVTRYKTVYKCCLNYHLVNGTCEECPPGTFGSNGNCDQICPEKFYGRFCSSECHCMENERCDKVIGCTCNYSCPEHSITTVKLKGSSQVTLNDTDSFQEQYICLKVSIILCCVIFSTIMLTISTSFVRLWMW